MFTVIKLGWEAKNISERLGYCVHEASEKTWIFIALTQNRNVRQTQ